MSTIPPTLPFKIASAYGVPISQRGRAALQAEGTAPLSIRQADTAELTAKPIVGDLLAGRVKQPIDFLDTDRPSAKPEAMPFYRHPADANTAATAVTLGQHLDLNG